MSIDSQIVGKGSSQKKTIIYNKKKRKINVKNILLSSPTNQARKKYLPTTKDLN
jgi:hypothetical protein